MTLIHLHIPKCGGMALNKALGAKFVGIKDLGENYDSGYKTTAHRLEGRAKVLASHWPYGVHQGLRGPYEYITCLRKPQDRILSLYNMICDKYLDAQPPHPGARWAAHSYTSMVLCYWRAQNATTRILSGLGLSYRGAVKRKHYLLAQMNLRRVRWVGVSENLQGLYDRVAEAHGLPERVVGQVNVSTKCKTTLTSGELRDTLRANSWDQLLYEEAVRLDELA